MKFFCFY